MEQGQFPHLRKHLRKMKDGAVVTYFFWDGRSRGVKDVPLGTDEEKAIERWRLCEQGIFPKKGRPLTKQLPARQPGKRRKIDADDWASIQPALRRMFLNAERRAEECCRPFTLTPQEFIVLVKRANGRCELTGIPFEPSGTRHPFSPSIDRMDAAKGYEPGNVRLICCIANTALSDWGLEPLLMLSEALLRKTEDQSSRKTFPQ